MYCFSRKDCEEVTSDLTRLGVKAGCYHADRTGQERTRVHMNWLKGSIKVSSELAKSLVLKLHTETNKTFDKEATYSTNRKLP